jgi:outer membrane receptor protein involved in Fe transport
MGGVATIAVNRGRHNFRVGTQIYGERDNQFYEVVDTTPASPDSFAPQRTIPWANIEAFFIEDQFKATSWLTFNGGVRLTHYGGPVNENAADPRIGAALRIPRLNWVLRGFYGRYYQAPPLVTVTEPALNDDQTFLPLRGERDEQHEIGLAIPLKGWSFDISNFRTTAKNFFDHDVLGNSNIFFPLTIDRARIRGWEVTTNSPRVAGGAQFHVAYSHQFVQGAGGVTGGLTEFEPPKEGFFFLDHDQRDTLSTGLNLALPWRVWADFNLSYGSGFLDGEGPEHLPTHTTYDLSLGKSFGENLDVRLTGLNLSNHRYLLDNSNTFGGTHFVNPLEISFQVKYRFHF